MGGGAQPVVNVFAGSGCRWTAVSNASWINVTFGQSGTGNGSFGYGVDPNNGPSRSGTILAAGIAFTVVEAGCAFTLAPSSASFPGNGGSGSFAVQTGSCTWNATSDSSWINITSGSGGPGSGTVAYTVAPNSTTAPRAGNINVGGTLFPMAEAACSIAVTPAGANVPVTGGSGTFQVTPQGTCAWTAQSTAGWITVTADGSGSGNGTVGYSAAANTGLLRSGGIRVNEARFTVTEAACAYTATPASLSFSAAGGPGSVSLATSAACNWTAASSVPWMAINGSASGSGPAQINLIVSANSGPQRSGALTIAGQTVAVSEADGSAAAVQLRAMANSASNAAGPVSPGEIVTIYGTNLGPPTLAQYQVSEGATSIATTLQGTRVLFDGVAAPMIYTSATQVSAVVPYRVAAAGTRIQVEYQGALSNALELDVAPVTPAVFSLDSTGAGQGAVLNQDYTTNGIDNPAAPGSVVQIFATGGGETNPPGVDGMLSAAPYPILVAPVTVTIGGVDAPVGYAGAAPDLVAGVVQVNAQVPPGLAAGAAAVVVAIGGVSSQVGVTIAVSGQ